MPASGKSYVGQSLSRILDFRFVDTDDILREQYNKSLPNLIRDCGLKKFVGKEGRILEGLNCEGTIISTGGSVVYSESGMVNLKKLSKIYFLDAPLDVIEDRIDNVTGRGVVILPGQTIRDLYDERLPVYQKYADETIDTRGKSVKQINNEIIATL